MERQIKRNGVFLTKSHLVWNENHPDDPVKEGEVVHHKDNNPTNDHPDNLEKMTRAQHMSFHAKERESWKHPNFKIASAAAASKRLKDPKVQAMMQERAWGDPANRERQSVKMKRFWAEKGRKNG